MLDYCVLAGLSILFLIGCLVHLRENDIFSLRTIRKFKRLIYALMFEVVIDCVFALLDGRDVDVTLLHLIKSCELGMNPVLAFLVFDVFYDGKRSERDDRMTKIRCAMVLMIVANCVLLMLSLFGWNVFYIDERSAYHRGPLMYVCLSILVIAISLLIYGMFLFSKKTQSTMKATLFSFTAFLVVGLILRHVFTDRNYDFLCMSVAVPLLLVYYSHVTLRVDSLTKLLNRRVYTRLLERIDYSTIVIMIDVNNFKLINDTYGHESGDQTLKQIAKVIRKAYGKYAYCFRLGGDEFCAILKPDVFEKLVEETPYCDVYSMAEQFMQRLDEKIAAKAEETSGGNPFLKYGVAQGYGIFYSKDKYPGKKENKSIEQVVELADKRMYRNKELFREKITQEDATPGESTTAMTTTAATAEN